MQCSLNIELPEDFGVLYAADPEQAMFGLLNAQNEKLAFMLQGYHTREKVRKPVFMEGSLELKDTRQGSLVVVYQLEEFNVCSNIDRTDTEKMTLSFTIDESAQRLELKGIYIPEREPDNL